MEILSLIVARGGSKGVPGKNLRPLGGLSLIGFKARSARRAQSLDRVIISTDCPDIQAEARRHGVEVPFTRPAELASDTATSASVVQHVIDYVETVEKRRYDAILLLEPSSPFGRAADYDAAVALYQERDAALVVGMRAVEPNPIFCAPLPPDGSIGEIVARINQRTKLRRQDLDSYYTMNGAFYLFSWDAFKATGRIYQDEQRSYGIAMDEFHSVEIDNPIDLAMAEFLVEKGYVDMADFAPLD